MSIINEKIYEDLVMNIDILKLNDKQSKNIKEIKKIGTFLNTPLKRLLNASFVLKPTYVL